MHRTLSQILLDEELGTYPERLAAWIDWSDRPEEANTSGRPPFLHNDQTDQIRDMIRAYDAVRCPEELREIHDHMNAG